MGWNTVVVLYNDQMSEWEQRMAQAARMFAPDSARSTCQGDFGYGLVISMDHADGDQVVVAGGNCGRRLSPIEPIQHQADLDALATILRGHGYSVKKPGQKRAEGPLCWGYAAAQAKGEG